MQKEPHLFLLYLRVWSILLVLFVSEVCLKGWVTFSVMEDPIETISFRSSDHEFLKSYHGDICGVLSRSEVTLITFTVMLYGKGIIDVHTKNAVIMIKGSEGADILIDRVEMKVEQTPRLLKRVLRMMKKLEDLETISRKIGSEISRSHPLLSSDMSSVEESSNVASPGEGECCIWPFLRKWVTFFCIQCIFSEMQILQTVYLFPNVFVCINFVYN